MIFVLLCLLSCILAGAFFASIQIALFSLTPEEVNNLSIPHRAQQVNQLLTNPRELLVTLLFCEVTASILLQNIMAHYASGWLMTVAIPILCTLLLGEVIPKSLALPHRMTLAVHVAPLMLGLRGLLRPICRPISYFTSSITHILFPYLKTNQELSSEEIAYLVTLSKNKGVLTHGEANWLHHYLSLARHTVKERMSPRHELVYYDLMTPPDHPPYFEHQTDIIICRGGLQNVLGTLSASDYLANPTLLQYPGMDLNKIHPPYFAPESLPLTSLFTHWLQTDSRLCLVVDEYGVISGWITRSQLMSLILNIPKSPTYPIHETLTLSGQMDLETVYQKYHLRLVSPHNIKTIGGWLIEQFGEIPKNGMTWLHEGLIFQVLEADANKIRTISIRKDSQ